MTIIIITMKKNSDSSDANDHYDGAAVRCATHNRFNFGQRPNRFGLRGCANTLSAKFR